MFKPRGKGSRQTKKKCVKSTAFSCKFTCLPRIQPSGKATICRNSLQGQASVLARWLANQHKRLLSPRKPTRTPLQSKNSHLSRKSKAAIACALNFSECKVYRKGVNGYEERTKDAANAYMDMFIADGLMSSIKKIASSMRNPFYYDLGDRGKLITDRAMSLFREAEQHPYGRQVSNKIKEMDSDIKDILTNPERYDGIDEALQLAKKHRSRTEPLYNLFSEVSYERIRQHLEENKEAIYQQVLPDIVSAQNEFRKTFKDNGATLEKINTLLTGVERKIRQESKEERKKASEKIRQSDLLINRLEEQIHALKKSNLSEEDYDERLNQLEKRLSKVEEQKAELEWSLEDDPGLSDAKELRELRKAELMLHLTTEDRLLNPFVDPDWSNDLQRLLKDRLDHQAIQSIIKTIQDDHNQYIER